MSSPIIHSPGESSDISFLSDSAQIHHSKPRQQTGCPFSLFPQHAICSPPTPHLRMRMASPLPFSAVHQAYASLRSHRHRRHHLTVAVATPPWKRIKSLDFTNASLKSAMKHATDTTMTRTQHERVTNMTHAAAMTTRTSLFLFVLGDVVTMQTLQSLQTTISGLASGFRALSTCI